MKKLEIVGFKRANLGSKGAKDLRAEALAPCVLYGWTCEQLGNLFSEFWLKL